jgi:hypothetical protein
VTLLKNKEQLAKEIVAVANTLEPKLATELLDVAKKLDPKVALGPPPKDPRIVKWLASKGLDSSLLSVVKRIPSSKDPEGKFVITLKYLAPQQDISAKNEEDLVDLLHIIEKFFHYVLDEEQR